MVRSDVLIPLSFQNNVGIFSAAPMMADGMLERCVFLLRLCMTLDRTHFTLPRSALMTVWTLTSVNRIWGAGVRYGSKHFCPS